MYNVVIHYLFALLQYCLFYDMIYMDWTGNKNSVFKTLGASNHTDKEREKDDYYATEPRALELLLELEEFSNVWECACGGGHLAEVLREHNILGIATDLVDRGYGVTGLDFLTCDTGWYGDIITNPPYKYAEAFVRKALEQIQDGRKVAMFMGIQFLEGKKRKKLYLEHPPKTVYVSSSRLNCAMNGDFDKYSFNSARAYCWYVWEKGYTGDTVIKWFN